MRVTADFAGAVHRVLFITFAKDADAVLLCCRVVSVGTIRHIQVGCYQHGGIRVLEEPRGLWSIEVAEQVIQCGVNAIVLGTGGLTVAGALLLRCCLGIYITQNGCPALSCFLLYRLGREDVVSAERG
jgi:hypothetical protein